MFVHGPSGSGKSTLLSLIGGVVMPQTGEVRVLGTNLSSLSSRRRDVFRVDHIGFVFQLFNLLPYLSLVENVLLPCRFSRRRRDNARAASGTLAAEVNRLLAHLGLDARKLGDRPVSELSVGQQQRVAAARALIGGPALIVADEPTSALDSDLRGAFLSLLFAEVENAGATLIFVSHDRSLERDFDRVLALQTINVAGAGG